MDERKNYIIVGIRREKETNNIEFVEMYQIIPIKDKPEFYCEDFEQLKNSSKKKVITYKELLNLLKTTNDLYFVARETINCDGIEHRITKQRITTDDVDNMLNNYLYIRE